MPRAGKSPQKQAKQKADKPAPNQSPQKVQRTTSQRSASPVVQAGVGSPSPDPVVDNQALSSQHLNVGNQGLGNQQMSTNALINACYGMLRQLTEDVTAVSKEVEGIKDYLNVDLGSYMLNNSISAGASLCQIQRDVDEIHKKVATIDEVAEGVWATRELLGDTEDSTENSRKEAFARRQARRCSALFCLVSLCIACPLHCLVLL